MRLFVRCAVFVVFTLTFAQAERKRTYPVVVDYDLSFDQMVTEGRYDWVNVGFHPHYFPIKGNGKQEVGLELVHFGRTVTDTEVEKLLGERGLKPASLAHLLAFGARYPEIQKKFPIAAIGSVWAPTRGDRLAPYLDASLRERLLNLSWGKGVWEGKFRFLAVRKN